MQNQSPPDLTAEIIAWLREELAISDCIIIDEKTSINKTLGVDGDDAIELIEAFGERLISMSLASHWAITLAQSGP